MEAFLLALISDRVALEKEYVAHFLSISSLRLPLLHGVSDLPPRKEETGDFSFSVAEFQDVRTLLLKGMPERPWFSVEMLNYPSSCLSQCRCSHSETSER